MSRSPTKMNAPTAYHQLGKFIVDFQRLEDAVNRLLLLMAKTDDAVVQILVNDLEYGKRLKAADVLFVRFVDLRTNTNAQSVPEFQKLMVELRKLGERRNDLVHSRYCVWRNVHEQEGLLRTNAKLRSSKSKREVKEEELQPEAFNGDLQRLAKAANELEKFRLQIIDWL